MLALDYATRSPSVPIWKHVETQDGRKAFSFVKRFQCLGDERFTAWSEGLVHKTQLYFLCARSAQKQDQES